MARTAGAYLDRVRAELNDLNVRTENLQKFILNNSKFSELTDDEQALLKEQLDAHLVLAGILGRRIALADSLPPQVEAEPIDSSIDEDEGVETNSFGNLRPGNIQTSDDLEPPADGATDNATETPAETPAAVSDTAEATA